MIPINQSKLIRSLRRKKYRDHYGIYQVEGEKMIGEFLEGNSGRDHQVQALFATQEFIVRNRDLLHGLEDKVREATPSELKKVSNLVTPPQVMALISQPDRNPNPENLLSTTVLAFESIRDPGNLGTIIRTADWFGINHIVCTPDSVDVFNPKVVQATMGAISRVSVYYLDFEHLLSKSAMREKVVYGTYLKGDSIYEKSLDKNPWILFGNESQGLSERYAPFIQHRITIPSYSGYRIGTESLNLASSVAIVCSELQRIS